MHILYFHGLNGSLSDEKRTTLEKYFTVEAPQIDYERDNVDEVVSSLCDFHTFDAIIGNSMGGYLAYHTARQLALPCLLFNPAIAERSVEIQYNPEELLGNHPLPVFLIIGKNDEVVSPFKCLDTIMGDTQNDTVYVTLHRNLEHRIDIETFSKEVERFAKQL
jgi:hypothetical protein